MSKNIGRSKSIILTKSVNSKIFEDTWELASKELLYPKYKFSYTDQEKIRLKRLIIFSPPPIEIRRKVRLKNKNFNLLINNIKIVMAQSIRSST